MATAVPSTPSAATPQAADGAQRKTCRFLGISLNHSSNFIFLSQVAFFCLYGGCTVFDTPYTGTTNSSTMSSTAGQGPDMIGANYMWWHVFVALAVFVGLPFIFMRRESTSVSTVGYGFLLATMAVEWAILMHGFWWAGRLTRTANPTGWPAIPINGNFLMNATYTAASVVITFASVAGRVSFGQAYFLSFFQVFFQTAVYIVAREMKIMEQGCPSSVHIFGATFGLAASLMLCRIATPATKTVTLAERRSTSASTFALLGAVVTFVLMPVFNIGNLPYILLEVPTDPVAQLQVMAVVPALAFRAYFNTIMAQASAVATAFMVSRANYAGRFSLWQVQGATMAGAVAISSAAPMLNNPWGALMTGAVVGVLHVITVNIVNKVRFFAIRDASAVVATHLVPGVIAATASAIAAARVTPGMGFGSTQTAVMIFDGRDVKVQGGYQLAYALGAFVLALLGGAFTGILMNVPLCDNKTEATFADADEWDCLEASAACPETAACSASSPFSGVAAKEAAAAPVAHANPVVAHEVASPAASANPVSVTTAAASSVGPVGAAPAV